MFGQKAEKPMKYAERANRIQPSLTMAVIDKSAALRSQGVDLIDLGPGEPDYETPEHIKQAAIQALSDGHTRYTTNVGITPLREAISEKLSRDSGVRASADQIIVSNGGKHALFNAMMAVLDPGSEIIEFSPYWVTFPEMAKLAGAEPVLLSCRETNHFEPDLDEVRDTITDRTAAILMNSPSNPTGVIYSEETVRGLYEIAAEHELFLISDECYDQIVYESGAVYPGMFESEPERVITVQSFSKSYAMTGWRVGYAAGNTELIKQMAKIQSQSTSHANTIAQYAAITALKSDQSFIREMVAEYEKRRNYVLERVRQWEGVTCATPEGAFYVFPNVSGYFGSVVNGRPLRDSMDMADFFLEQAHVTVVPGVGFGADEHIRISYSTSMEELRRGLTRMEKALQQLEIDNTKG